MLYALALCIAALSPDVCARAVVSPGNTARLHAAFDRARDGPIMIGAIGGSITQAGGYLDGVAARFGPVLVRNAGLSATESYLGAHRVSEDLLDWQPDVVIIDYAVNDATMPLLQRTYEGLVRRILNEPQAPAVILVFFMLSTGENSQSQQIPIGAHYGLPMISFRDALWPEIEAGNLAVEDILLDTVHPNSTGHQYAADMLIAYLEGVLSEPPDAPRAMPPPLYSGTFARAEMLDATYPVTLTGQWGTPPYWSDYPAEGPGWAAQPGATLTCDVTGTAVGLAFLTTASGGLVTARVDNLAPFTFDTTGAAWRFSTALIAENLTPGPHTLSVEAHGEAWLYGVMAAGPSEPEMPAAGTAGLVLLAVALILEFQRFARY